MGSQHGLPRRILHVPGQNPHDKQLLAVAQSVSRTLSQDICALNEKLMMPSRSKGTMIHEGTSDTRISNEGNLIEEDSPGPFHHPQQIVLGGTVT